MHLRAFQQIDVFSDTAYRGNPVAVVLDADDLDTEQMQAFARWTNLSETTFVLAPTAAGRAAGAHYRLRIFTPAAELPFAGHPTLGSCHAWLHINPGRAMASGDVSDVFQECGVGLVRIRRDGARLSFAAPTRLRGGPLADDEVDLIARGLGIDRREIVRHAWCDNGPKWRGVMLRSADAVLALQPDAGVLAGLYTGVVGPTGAPDRSHGKVGVVGAHGLAPVQTPAALGATAPAFEVRAFFPDGSGLGEDPVTGSLNAALAQWLIGEGLAPDRYIAAQGTVLGRAGRVHIAREGSDIWVGGDCVRCISGEVLL